MRHLLLLFLLLLPAATLAQPTYDLSCENVAKIRIGRMEDTYYNVESHKGFFHFIYFNLTHGAGAHFARVIDDAPIKTFVYRSEEWTKQHIALTASGKPLRDNAPSLSGFSREGVFIAISREKDAFDAARAVCPALVPRKVIVDWERDWEPGWERREFK
jgi:hypothetical protein